MLRVKKEMQKVNASKEWDEEISEEEKRVMKTEMEAIQGFVKRIPRCIVDIEGHNKLIVCCDASKQAIGIAVYAQN